MFLKEFKLSKYLTIKLEDGYTNIYVNGEYFEQCKYLLLNISKKSLHNFDKVESIDEAAEILNHSMEGESGQEIEISPEAEFWGHCSNLQVWIENDYDTRLLHSNLAFPLLKKLAYTGDLTAKKVFKEEIALRLLSGYPSVVSYLIEEGYLEEFSIEEKEMLSEQFVEKVQSIKSFEEFCELYLCFHTLSSKALNFIVPEQFIELVSQQNFLNKDLEGIEKVLDHFDSIEINEIFDIIKNHIVRLEQITLYLLYLKLFSDHGIKQARQMLRDKVIQQLLGDDEDLVKFIIDGKFLQALNNSDLRMFIDFPGCSKLLVHHLSEKLNAKLKDVKIINFKPY